MGHFYIAAACPCRQLHRIYVEGTSRPALNKPHEYLCPNREHLIVFYPRIPAYREKQPDNTILAKPCVQGLDSSQPTLPKQSNEG